VLMFAAGGLVWANTRAEHDGRMIGLDSRLGNWVPTYVRGFPIPFQAWYDDRDINHQSRLLPLGMIIDALTLIGTLVLTGVASEIWWLRRKIEWKIFKPRRMSVIMAAASMFVGVAVNLIPQYNGVHLVQGFPLVFYDSNTRNGNHVFKQKSLVGNSLVYVCTGVALGAVVELVLRRRERHHD